MNEILRQKKCRVRKEIGLRIQKGGYVRNRDWEFVEDILGHSNIIKILNLCSEERRPKTVVDLGCGEGEAVRDLSRMDLNIKPIGIDIFLENNRRRNKNNQPQFIFGDAEEIPLKSKSVDILYSTQTYRYICDKLQFLSEIFRVLKPGGLGFVDIISSTIEPSLGCILGELDQKDIFRLDDSGKNILTIKGGDFPKKIDWPWNLADVYFSILTTKSYYVYND